MSRIAKNPVVIAKGVDCKLTETTISMKGPKGELSLVLSPLVNVKQDGDQITFEPVDASRAANAASGTMRALINDMNKGVSVGFEKKLTLVGVGYRAQASGDTLNLSLGFSHPVVHKLPEGVKAETPTSKRLVKPLLSSVATVRRNPIRARVFVMLTKSSSSRKRRRSNRGGD